MTKEIASMYDLHLTIPPLVRSRSGSRVDFRPLSTWLPV